MDIINIIDLEVFSKHGVMKEENILGQKFLVSAEIHIDSRKAGKEDDINQSVNYSQICHMIKKIMDENTFRLIETVAETISETLLINFEKIIKLKTEVKKPWAPILLPLDYVSVSIERSWHTVYLSLGSNMGSREKYLSDALSSIRSSSLCKEVRVSDFIETKPVGGVEQNDFINCCVELRTLMTPHELLEFTSAIEQKANRKRTIHWGPRTLDIDIILFDDIIISDSALTIPHIEMANREFVLKPLCQLNPYAMNPVLRMSAYELYKSLPSPCDQS